MRRFTLWLVAIMVLLILAPASHAEQAFTEAVSADGSIRASIHLNDKVKVFIKKDGLWTEAFETTIILGAPTLRITGVKRLANVNPLHMVSNGRTEVAKLTVVVELVQYEGKLPTNEYRYRIDDLGNSQQLSCRVNPISRRRWQAHLKKLHHAKKV